MFKIKVLSKENTEEILEMKEVIEVVESVYTQKAEGDADVFPLVFHEFNPGVADMDIKSGWLHGSGIFGLKLVSWFSENPKKDLPALIGTIMVLDDKTGAPIGILDGAHITGMRTGAAGAIGAKLLARRNSEKLLLIGAGHIATFQIAATLEMFPGIKTVSIYDPLSYDFAVKKADGMRNTLKELFGMSISEEVVFEAVEDIEEKAGDSDIIITVTPSKSPIVKKEWVKPGTHFSCIGADMAGKEEIDPEIFREARVFTDDTNQCINVGEIEIPCRMGILEKDEIAGEIGDILIGKTIGRENEEQITVFDATGTALLDLATAKQAFAKAEEKKIGQVVEL